MLDKKKLVLFGALGALVLIVVVAFITWTIASLGSGVDEADPSPSASPSESASISPELAAFTPELKETAVAVAIAASSWSSAATDESRAKQYENAGMSSEYASVYKPIWAGVFADTTMSEVTSSVRTEPVVMDVDGELGYLTFKVAVTVDWRASWNFGEGQKFQPGSSNPWILTVDENTGLVTAVDQPAVDDIDITLDRPSS